MSADKILEDGPAPRVIEHSWTDIRDWIAEVFGDRNPSALAMLDLGIEAGLDRYLALTTPCTTWSSWRGQRSGGCGLTKLLEVQLEELRVIDQTSYVKPVVSDYDGMTALIAKSPLRSPESFAGSDVRHSKQTAFTMSPAVSSLMAHRRYVGDRAARLILTAVLRERRSRRWSVTSSKGEAVYDFQLSRVAPG